jgi:hypothetical protein
MKDSTIDGKRSATAQRRLNELRGRTPDEPDDLAFLNEYPETHGDVGLDKATGAMLGRAGQTASTERLMSAAMTAINTRGFHGTPLRSAMLLQGLPEPAVDAWIADNPTIAREHEAQYGPESPRAYRPYGQRGDLDGDEENQHSTFEPVLLDDYLAKPIPPLTWIVDRMIPASGIGVLLASEKVGKSAMAAQIALSVVSGLPVMGRATVACPVLYVEEEGNPGAWQHRLRVMKRHLNVPDGAPAHIVHRQLVRLTKKEHLERLEQYIVEHRIGLVLIGPLSQSADIEDENKSGEINALMRRMNAIVGQTGCTIILIHHRNKTATGRGVRAFFNSTRGSNSLTAALDCAIGLDRDVESSMGRLFLMMRDAAPAFEHYKFDFDTLTATPVDSTDDAVTGNPQREWRFEAFLYHHPGAGSGEVGEGEPGAEQDINRVTANTAASTLAKMMEAGHVKLQLGDRKAKHWWLTESHRRVVATRLGLAYTPNDPAGPSEDEAAEEIEVDHGEIDDGEFTELAIAEPGR